MFDQNRNTDDQQRPDRQPTDPDRQPTDPDRQPTDPDRQPTDPDRQPTEALPRPDLDRRTDDNAHGAVTRRRLSARQKVVAGALLFTVAWTGSVSVGHELADNAVVTLVEDATARTVRTEDGTVEAVLAGAGLTVGKHDVVTPALTDRVSHGDRITLVRAKDVLVSIDGQAQRVPIAAVTVEDAVESLATRSDADVRASRSGRRVLTDGVRIEVRNPQRVAVVADGRRQVVTTTATNPVGVLTDAGVTVDADDLVQLERDNEAVDEDEFVRTGDVVRVVRVAVTNRTESTVLPFTHAETKDPNATVGTRKVARTGVNGRVDKTVAVTTHDGKVVTEKVVATTTVPATAQVTTVGTKAQPVRRAAVRGSRPVSGAGGAAAKLNWAALARCESGGNPRAVSATGKYRGLYQFSRPTWASVGGAGDPAAASATEQTARAQALYNKAGRGQWPVCGRHL